MDRQFVKCAFDGSDRLYTYHNDGPPAAVGERGTVDTKKGRASVTVMDVTDEAPPFETKPFTPLGMPVD